MPQNFDAIVTTTATALDALASPSFSSLPQRAREVFLQADAGNTLTVEWGDSTTQNISIAPGEERIIPVEIIGEIFVKVASGTETLHCSWIV